VTDALVVPGHDGTITVAPAALERLVVRAVESVEGARVRRPKRSVEIAHGDGRATVSFELAVGHDVPAPELARAVQARVAEAVAATSGLEIERVDVTVMEIA
jgi:uncharacterized alkaline shock family protein YloU